MNTTAEIEEALRDLRSGHFIRDDPRDAGSGPPAYLSFRSSQGAA